VIGNGVKLPILQSRKNAEPGQFPAIDGSQSPRVGLVKPGPPEGKGALVADKCPGAREVMARVAVMGVAGSIKRELQAHLQGAGNGAAS